MSRAIPFRHAFDSMNDLVFIKDDKQVYIYCNPAYASFYDMKVSDIVGKTDREIHTAENADLFLKSDELLLQGKTDCTIVERWVSAPEGPRFIITEKSLIRDDDGVITGIFGLAKDRTRTQSLQDELQQSEARFRSMFNEHTALMLLFNPENGTIVDANPAACAFFGYNREKFRSLTVSDISTMSQETRRQTIKGIRDNDISHFITTDRLADGTLRDMEIYASPISGSDGKRLLFAILHDVTDRIRMERELIDLNAELESRVSKEIAERRKQEQILVQQSKMAAMGEMIAAIAHQWKQPLNVLSLAVQDVLDEFDLGELTRDYLVEHQDVMLKQIEHMNLTIEGFRKLLEPSRKRTTFCIRTTIAETLDLFASQYASRNIRFEFSCTNPKHRTETRPPGFGSLNAPIKGFCSKGNVECSRYCVSDPVLIDGYPNEMKQVLLNIVNNARDAIIEAREKGVMDKAEPGIIRITIDEIDDSVVLTIDDNGGGIPGAILERIFEPYFTTKAEGIGTGIGLYMSKTIIETHMNGKITACNTDDGARIIITLKTSTRDTATPGGA